MPNTTTAPVAYTYAAALYCPDCIVGVVSAVSGALDRNTERALTQLAVMRQIDRTDEHTFDSDDFPKIVMDDTALERGDSCERCMNVLKPFTQEDCLNHSEHCEGDVEYRMPLSGTGLSTLRCDWHWSERLDQEQALRERYPEHAPSGWSHYDAGEYWSEADY